MTTYLFCIHVILLYGQRFGNKFDNENPDEMPNAEDGVQKGVLSKVVQWHSVLCTCGTLLKG
jgi:hypothetical protein